MYLDERSKGWFTDLPRFARNRVSEVFLSAARIKAPGAVPIFENLHTTK